VNTIALISFILVILVEERVFDQRDADFIGRLKNVHYAVNVINLLFQLLADAHYI
jgi:hypothetical protein